jgi:uncharacterized protein (DUF2225 family)
MVLLAGLAIMGTAVTVAALTYKLVKKTCPLCKTDFKFMEEASGTQLTVELDLRPIGPIDAPWPIPVCPKCKFVLYQDQIAQEELEKCQRIVSGADYKSHSERASYYLLGILYEKLEKDDLTLANVFLKASWQEEGSGSKFEEDLKISEKHFAAFLAKASKHDQAWRSAQLVIGEIKRRLKHFDESKKHFEGLKTMKEFQENLFGRIVDFQLRLIAEKDSNPHSLQEMDKAK